MIWLSIIFAIIQAIPEIIKIIQAILAAIHGHGNQPVHRFALENALLTWHATQDHEALKANLNAMATNLGVPAP